jgi:hypothetical protein
MTKFRNTVVGPSFVVVAAGVGVIGTEAYNSATTLAPASTSYSTDCALVGLQAITDRWGTTTALTLQVALF